MKKEKYTAVIVGCGSIGALKNDKYDSPQTENILTHAHACYAHPRVDLIGVIDNDWSKALKAGNKWNTGRSNHISSLRDSWSPDIVIVATPTETHHKVLIDLIDYHYPKLVIAEKPFCAAQIEAQGIVDYYKNADIPLAINYMRRYEMAHQTIKKWIDEDKLGKAFHCKITYTRGIRREASHAIDLMNWWFGKCLIAQTTTDKYGIDDYSKEDLTKAAAFTYEKCPHVFLCPVDGRKYSIFEIDMLFEKARIRFVDHGIRMEFYEPIPEPIYGDYMTMPSEVSWAYGKTGLTRGLTSLLDNAINFLDSGEELKCTGEDALKVHEVFECLEV